MTGTTPLGRKSLRELGYSEVLRRIQEEEPPRPSTRIAGAGTDLAGIAANRNVEPARLTRLVRGELDWIVMKALEKDRARRYETASGLARDIERFLNDEPVEAGPPSTSYRLRKFARRYRTALATVGAFAILLVSASAVSLYLAIRAHAGRAQSPGRSGKSQAVGIRSSRGPGVLSRQSSGRRPARRPGRRPRHRDHDPGRDRRR